MHRPLAPAVAVAVIGLLGTPPSALAWDDHALITWAALHDAQGMTWPSVPTCSLDDLLTRRLPSPQEPRLADVLDEAEHTAATLQSVVPPRPDALRFEIPSDFAARSVMDRASPIPTNGAPVAVVARTALFADLRALRRSLTMALRLDPDSKLANFVQLAPGQTTLRDLSSIAVVDVAVAPSVIKVADMPLRTPPTDRILDAPTLLSSFSDEPDYGFDYDLFADNHSIQAPLYGFGDQPFGNSKLSFGTQAPFHMGYYHESSLLYRLAPAFRRTFPELRAAQFTALARWAFSSPDKSDTCSTYWGLRFLGWSLHYVQDLTQPYHASIFPGKSTAGMIWINTLDKLGIHGPKQRAVTLLSNRHLVLENIARERLAEELAKPAHTSVLVERMAQIAPDAALPGFELADLRSVVSLESYADAPEMDKLLAECIPAHFVDDPTYDFGANPEPQDLYAVLRRQTSPSCALLLEKIDTRLVRAAVHTRRVVRAFLPNR